MLRNERNIALLCFKVEIYKRMGDEFQNFFEEIMSKSNDGFKTVKPWGSVGDKKMMASSRQQVLIIRFTHQKT